LPSDDIDTQFIIADAAIKASLRLPLLNRRSTRLLLEWLLSVMRRESFTPIAVSGDGGKADSDSV
jgi:hypothetical protein